MWLTVLKWCSNPKNAALVILVLACLGLFTLWTAQKGKTSSVLNDLSISKIETSEQKLIVGNLKASISVLETSISLQKVNETVYQANIEALKQQIKANNRSCSDTINKIKESCGIFSGSTTICLDPSTLQAVDQESSKQYINLLNGMVK